MPERKRLETIVLEMERDGVIRISGTRVPLETVIAAFQDGATPEEIVQQYPSIPLGDLYQVGGYYLSNRKEIERYLETRLSQTKQTKQANEARWKPDGIRERLLSRRRGQSRLDVRWLADENFNNDLLRALLRRQPEIDIVRVQDVGLSGANDASVLAWAAQQDRVLLTHDMSTVTAEAYSAHGEPRTNARGFRSLTLGCNLPSGRGHSFAHGV